MVDETVRCRWEQEQTLLGLARDTPAGEFARGGLARLPEEPTVRIMVLPGDPSSHAVRGPEPSAVIPTVITLPGAPEPLRHEAVHATPSGYMGHTIAEGGQRQSYDAVRWHGGVDVFLGAAGSRVWEYRDGSRCRVVFMTKCVGWAWAAFGLQRLMV